MTDVFVRRVNHSEYRSSPQPKVPISVFSVPFYCAVMHWLSVATPVVLRCYRYSGRKSPERTVFASYILMILASCLRSTTSSHNLLVSRTFDSFS